MEKKKKILLVEDDKRFGESLQKILEKEGFECIFAEKPQTALSLCKLHTFDVAIVDCMLPQMNGVELAVKIKETYDSSLVLFMMSGIYKDRNFSISALKKTGAKSFLIKPFEVSNLVSQIKESLPDDNSGPILSDNPIKNLMLQENISQNIVQSTFEKVQTINGQELPLIINYLLMYKCQGKIILKSESIEFPIHINAGVISIPLIKCTGPKLKNILISKECVPQDDLAILKLEDTTIERLIEMNYLSPHFGDSIYKESSMNQLHAFSKNIQVNLSFEVCTPPHQSITFQQREIDDLIYTWTINAEPIWLKTYYLPYIQHNLKKLNTSQNKTQLFPIVSGNKELIAVMLQGKTIEEVLNANTANDGVAIRLVHLMMIFREFYIGSKANIVNYGIQIERLKKLFSAMETQNAFERMGLKENASEQEIKRAYNELAQSLHPDKLKDVPQELIVISTKVYDKIQDAYNSIKTPDKREEYSRLLEAQKSEKHARANRLLDEATNHLMRGDLTAAETQVQTANTLSPYLPRLKLLHTWLQVKAKKISAQEGMKIILTVPNEDKDTSLYLHVRGLCHVALNELDKASLSFKNAIAKDPNFVASKRELSMITQDDKKPAVSILNADLRDVVGMFFNKKPKKK